MTQKFLILFMAAFLIASGCAKKPDFENESLQKSYKEEVEAYKRMQANKVQTASLWDDRSNGSSLFLDYKARQVGDLVVINIVENSSASNNNSTDTSKTSNHASSMTNILGLPTNLGITNFLGKGNPLDPSLESDSSATFKGSGKKSKSDSLNATIAARIIDILPSGNLVIEGQREIIIDQEKQTIKISGIVRQKDIDADNTVLSTSVADAKISYSGKGILTDSNTPGWLSTLISWIWPL